MHSYIENFRLMYRIYIRIMLVCLNIFEFVFHLEYIPFFPQGLLKMLNLFGICHLFITLKPSV